MSFAQKCQSCSKKTLEQADTDEGPSVSTSSSFFKTSFHKNKNFLVVCHILVPQKRNKKTFTNNK